MDEAYAGDIVGLFDPGMFSIGDTLCAPGARVQFAGIPTFAPEHFARVSQVDTMKRKQFVKGMEELAQEGAIQIFRELGAGMESVIVGVVGTLQFDVLEQRLKSEYRVEVRRQPLGYTGHPLDSERAWGGGRCRAQSHARHAARGGHGAAASCCSSRARGTWIGRLSTTRGSSFRSFGNVTF